MRIAEASSPTRSKPEAWRDQTQQRAITNTKPMAPQHMKCFLLRFCPLESYTFGKYVLPCTFAQFCARHPSVRPTVVISNTREVVNHVAEGKLDIGITEGTHTHAVVRSVVLRDDEMVVLASHFHPLAGNRERSRELLAQQTWIIREECSGTREAENLMFTRFSVHPAQVMGFGCTQVIKESVEAGLGLTVLSRCAVSKELQLHALTVLAFPKKSIVRQFYIVTRENPLQT